MEAAVGLLGSAGLRLWHQVHLGLRPGSVLTCWVTLGSCLPSLSLGFLLHKELPPGVIVDGSCEPRAFHLTVPTRSYHAL